MFCRFIIQLVRLLFSVLCFVFAIEIEWAFHNPLSSIGQERTDSLFHIRGIYYNYLWNFGIFTYTMKEKYKRLGIISESRPWVTQDTNMNEEKRFSVIDWGFPKTIIDYGERVETNLIVPFFKFPAEIRILILERLFLTGEICVPQSLYPMETFEEGNSPYGVIKGLEHPLLMVSRQMRAEAAKVFFQKHFYFPGSWFFTKSIRQIGHFSLQYITAISINWTVEGAREALQQLAKLTNLKVLRLSFPSIFLRDDAPTDLRNIRGIKELKNLSMSVPNLKVYVDWEIDDIMMTVSQNVQFFLLEQWLKKG